MAFNPIGRIQMGLFCSRNHHSVRNKMIFATISIMLIPVLDVNEESTGLNEVKVQPHIR
jgi:hypothetical protein